MKIVPASIFYATINIEFVMKCNSFNVLKKRMVGISRGFRHNTGTRTTTHEKKVMPATLESTHNRH